MDVVDAAHGDVDAETRKGGLVEQDDAFPSRRIAGEAEHLDAQDLAGAGVDLLVIAHLVARLPQEPHPLAQVGAHLLRGAGDRIGIRGGEDLARHLVAQRLQDLELLPVRQPGAGELGALEVAIDPPVLAEEELLVHLLEVEGEIERAPHPRVLELVAPRVEGEGPHQPPVALGELLEDDPLVGDRGKIVARGPGLGAVLDAPVRMVGLEGFHRDRRVAKILEADLVEVVAPDIDVQILGPIVLHPPVDHPAAGDEVLDAVGAVAERRLERGGADVALLARGVAALPPVLGQHPQRPEDHRDFMVAGGVEREGDLALAGLLDLRDVAVEGADEGVVFLVGLEGEDHVLDRDRLAVVVAGGGA